MDNCQLLFVGTHSAFSFGFSPFVFVIVVVVAAATFFAPIDFFRAFNPSDFFVLNYK